MKIQEMIAGIDPAVRADAEELLKSESFYSVDETEDGYEALIFTGGSLLLTNIVLAHDGTVMEYECQCSGYSAGEICVHIAAMLLYMECVAAETVQS